MEFFSARHPSVRASKTGEQLGRTGEYYPMLDGIVLLCELEIWMGFAVSAFSRKEWKICFKDGSQGAAVIAEMLHCFNSQIMMTSIGMIGDGRADRIHPHTPTHTHARSLTCVCAHGHVPLWAQEADSEFNANTKLLFNAKPLYCP